MPEQKRRRPPSRNGGRFQQFTYGAGRPRPRRSAAAKRVGTTTLESPRATGTTGVSAGAVGRIRRAGRVERPKPAGVSAGRAKASGGRIAGRAKSRSGRLALGAVGLAACYLVVGLIMVEYGRSESTMTLAGEPAGSSSTTAYPSAPSAGSSTIATDPPRSTIDEPGNGADGAGTAEDDRLATRASSPATSPSSTTSPSSNARTRATLPTTRARTATTRARTITTKAAPARATTGSSTATTGAGGGTGIDTTANGSGSATTDPASSTSTTVDTATSSTTAASDGGTGGSRITVGFEDAAADSAYSSSAQSGDWDLWWQERFDQNSTISSEQARSGGQSLRITYPAGTSGGASAAWRIEPAEEYYLSYWVQFGEGFDFDGDTFSGGKLPGLASGDSCAGGSGCDGTNGFSVRYMWREQGAAELYLYDMTADTTYGRSVDFSQGVTFQPGTWHHLVQRVRANTVGVDDGLVQVWVDGTQVIDLDGLRFRTDDHLIDNVYFTTYFGGSDPGWYPSVDSYAWFDDLVVSTNPADVGL